MADVFISYAQARRELAQALTKDLEAAGLSVWWDTGLVPNQHFRKEIDAQLDAAGAVVILWTLEALDSLWVSSEADHALRQGKLVNTHVSELSPEQIPKPFNQIHSVGIENRSAVIAAVQQIRSGSEPRPISGIPQPRPQLTLPDRPSIAVLPFANLSGDASQEYFSDGITEDIITELSRFAELFVIARNSSFQYKGKFPDIRRVGRELGVRYVLEGSIRRAGDRVRITAQLVDAMTGGHLWAERYDREIKDVFAVQDEAARRIVTILAAHVNKAETERTLLKPPASWQAYDYFMQATDVLGEFFGSFRVEKLYEARRLLKHALTVDPNYARALATLSICHIPTFLQSLDGDFLCPAILDQAYQAALRAAQIDPSLPQARAALGEILTLKGHHDAAIAEWERAFALNPNFTDWRFARALVLGGQSARAVEVINAQMRLDPFYPPLAPGWLGFAHYMAKRYSEALQLLHECVSRLPNVRFSHSWLAATYAQLGELEKARAEAAEVLRIEPNYTIGGTQRRSTIFKFPQDAEHFFDGLRKAGLPEK